MGSTIELRDCYKTYSHDQDKVRNPRDTIAWVRERLAAGNTDILANTARIDNGRLDIPVFISLCGEDATRFTGTKKQMGKGATPEQSEASALMELMERYSFFTFIEQCPFPMYAYGEMASMAVSADTLLASLHDRQTSVEDCRAFLETLPLRWATARNLTRRLVLPDQRVQRSGGGEYARRGNSPSPLRGGRAPRRLHRLLR
jgi:ribosomal protein S12 methylthiotransferase accessory factor